MQVRLRIEEIAVAKGLNRKGLADKAALNQHIVGRYWRNFTTSVDLVKLGQMAQALEVEPGELIGTTKEGT